MALYISDANGQLNKVAGNFAEDAGKANTDLSNVTYPAITAGSTTTGSGDRVIEQYMSSDSKTWYRKWASGWKECGLVLDSGSWATHTVTLPIAFSNTQYIIETSIVSNANFNTATSNPISILTLTTSSFTAMYESTDVKKRIYCCGY